MDKTAISITKGNTYDMHVMWDLHHRCNYHCSYCLPELNTNSDLHLEIEPMKKFVDLVVDHYVNKIGHKHILFSFTGGEPTLWKGMEEYIIYLHSKNIRCGLTTNGSVGLNFWKRTSRYFDYICLSYHPEFADPERFAQTFEFLHDDPETVVPSVRLMMHKEDKFFAKSVAMLERIKQFPNWTYECVYILDNYGTDYTKITDYPSKEKELFLKENAFRYQFTDVVHVPPVLFDYRINYDDGSSEKLDENLLINKNMVNFKGWDCDIGIDSLFIYASGDIRRAGCPAGKSYGSLGNVFRPESIQLPTKSVKCNVSSCFCPTDIRISKRSL